MRRLALLLLACMGFLFSCNRIPEPPFQLATNVWAGFEPLYLARQLGYLDPKAVRLVEMPSSTDSMRALRAGLIDAAALTLDEALILAQDGVELRVALVMDTSKGADAIVSRSNIKSLQDLKGKRIGVEAEATGAYLLSRALDHAGMHSRDVLIVNMAPGSQEEAFLNGDVEALATFEPTRTRLLGKGGKLLFDSSRIPNEIFDVLVVRRQAFLERSREIEKIRRAWFQSLDYLKQNPSEAASLMAPREAMDPLAFGRSLEGLEFPDREKESVLRTVEMEKVTARLAEQMLKRRLLKKPLDTSMLFSKN